MERRFKQRFAVVVVGLLCFSYQSTLFAQKSDSSPKGVGASAFQPSKPSVGTVIESRKPRENWLPEDVDDAIPPVAAGVACSLPMVLQGAAQRVVELVKNVDRFTATEVLMHQDVNRSGRVGRPVTVKFNYLVSISEGRDGFLGVEELRNRSQSLASFPSHIATTGTPSLVLIFHPRYIDDFRTQCEGLGDWHGQPAWQVRFEQRSDRSSRICSFVLNGSAHDVNLRGRAWILADSFQVAKLETDLRESVPSIRLNLSHENIEYRPVSLPSGDRKLWLPFSTELYVDFRGHRFYRKHSFTDFKIFSVDMQYQTAEPRQAASAQ